MICCMGNFWSSFLTILFVVFMAEIPCILRTVVLQVRSDGIWPVVLGTIGGSLLALSVGVAIGKLTTDVIPGYAIDWVQCIAGITMIGLGFFMVLNQHGH